MPFKDSADGQTQYLDENGQLVGEMTDQAKETYLKYRDMIFHGISYEQDGKRIDPSVIQDKPITIIPLPFEVVHSILAAVGGILRDNPHDHNGNGYIEIHKLMLLAYGQDNRGGGTG